MKNIVVVLAVSLLLTDVGMRAQMPTAAPEHKRLAYFAGTWNFEGTTKDSPMGPGGPISFKEVCELMEGGFALVCRSDGKSPAGPTKAVAIMSYDVDKKTYTYTAAESKMPVITATGQAPAQTWTWTTTTNMAGQAMTTRVTIKEGGPTTYDMTMEMSMDGKTFAPVMSGKATRVST